MDGRSETGSAGTVRSPRRGRKESGHPTDGQGPYGHTARAGPQEPQQVFHLYSGQITIGTQAQFPTSGAGHEAQSWERGKTAPETGTDRHQQTEVHTTGDGVTFSSTSCGTGEGTATSAKRPPVHNRSDTHLDTTDDGYGKQRPHQLGGRPPGGLMGVGGSHFTGAEHSGPVSGARGGKTTPATIGRNGTDGGRRCTAHPP